MPYSDTSTIAGFAPILDGTQFIVNGASINTDISNAIQDSILERTTQGASTITVQLSDPYRDILRSGFVTFGATLEFDDLMFSLVEGTKEGDTLQVVFEAWGVAMLRGQIGVQATSESVDLTGWVQSLVAAVPSLQFVAQQDPLAAQVQLGRGTDDDPTEDSWTAIQRVVTSAGWRCFESQNVIYLGSDQFFQGFPSQGTLTEFTQATQNMDFDWDIGQPFGTVTVTGMTDQWAYPPGSVVNTLGMGPLDGQPWLVQDCQRDMFNPQCTATLYVPQTPQYVINGPPEIAPF